MLPSQPTICSVLNLNTTHQLYIFRFSSQLGQQIFRRNQYLRIIRFVTINLSTEQILNFNYCTDTNGFVLLPTLVYCSTSLVK